MEGAAEATTLISSPIAVTATLAAVAAFFFWLERATGWKLFKYMIPLIWIYAVPMVMSNTGVLPHRSPAYDLLGTYIYKTGVAGLDFGGGAAMSIFVLALTIALSWFYVRNLVKEESR